MAPLLAPRLRLLEPIPVEVKGQQLVVLRDPMRTIPHDVSVGVPVYMLLTLMDGERTLPEIRRDFQERFGGEVTEQELEALVRQLDEALLLDNERSATVGRQVVAEFRDASVRPPAHAGSAYNDDAAALAAEMDALLDAAPRATAPVDSEGRPRALRAIVAPHIDPRVGGACAAHAFAALDTADPAPDLFVIFGTAHQPSDSLFVLTEKDFRTPLGTAPVDREAVRALIDAARPLDLLRDEYLHKHEHSIEFQVLFLQHIFGKRRPHDFQILPILVGSFRSFIEDNEFPSESPQMLAFVNALRGTIARSGKRVCFVAGADLSHMGQKFGDREGPTEEFIADTRQGDEEMLDHIARMRPEEFFRQIQSEEDRQKVCGLPPIYTLMQMLAPETTGRLLDYGVHVEKETASFVSFASMAFYG
jgi:AmmeMemoRadiSam system protein B